VERGAIVLWRGYEAIIPNVKTPSLVTGPAAVAVWLLCVKSNLSEQRAETTQLERQGTSVLQRSHSHLEASG